MFPQYYNLKEEKSLKINPVTLESLEYMGERKAMQMIKVSPKKSNTWISQIPKVWISGIIVVLTRMALVSLGGVIDFGCSTCLQALSLVHLSTDWWMLNVKTSRGCHFCWLAGFSQRITEAVWPLIDSQVLPGASVSAKLQYDCNSSHRGYITFQAVLLAIIVTTTHSTIVQP